MKMRIVAVIATASGVTLYKEDGSTIPLDASVWKAKQILMDAAPVISQGGIYELDLSKYSVMQIVQDNSKGRLRFLEVAASKLASFFSFKKNDTEVPQTKDSLQKTLDLLSQPPATIEPMTKVAVINDTIIPDVENIQPHMEAAVESGNTKGIERFLARLSTVVADRSHSVQELMTFMKRADLPIADDGCIVAYKILKSSGNRFVDAYTGKVYQKLGSRVEMDISLVDPDRRNECSSGLHIARRAYLGNFGGDIMTIVKIAPEDVVAVPAHDPNKMRVRGYHIVAVIPPALHATLRSNQPMTSSKEAARMLNDVLRGNHVGVTEIVTIGGHKGSNLSTKNLSGGKVPEIKSLNQEARAIDDTQLVIAGELRQIVQKAADAAPVQSTPPKATPVAQSAPAEKTIKDLPESQQKALALYQENKYSKAEIARLTGVSTRNLGRLIERYL